MLSLSAIFWIRYTCIFFLHWSTSDKKREHNQNNLPSHPRYSHSLNAASRWADCISLFQIEHCRWCRVMERDLSEIWESNVCERELCFPWVLRMWPDRIRKTWSLACAMLTDRHRNGFPMIPDLRGYAADLQHTKWVNVFVQSPNKIWGW